MAAGLVSDMVSGVALAAECIDTGKAIEKLNELVSFTNKATT
jgi:anthranilate phosphoribosyltransferase